MVSGRRRHRAVSYWVQGEARKRAGARERLGALGALAARSSLVWHGRGGTHGGLRAGLAWGIDPGLRHVASGEVTVQGLVGAGQPKLGAHDGQGDGAGGVGCLHTVAASWGQF
jgi:hypothetical protein